MDVTQGPHFKIHYRDTQGDGKRNLCLLGSSFDATMQQMVTYLRTYAS